MLPPPSMPGYQVKHETVTVAGLDYTIRSLLDLRQNADPEGLSARLGLSASSWALFGHVWPSARVLALEMSTHALAGKRILELGAGLALASLVMHRRLGDVTVSDWHPLCRPFLDENLRLNGLGPMTHHAGNWESENLDLGRFDLIVGSDILYERQQPAQLAAFIVQHAAPTVEVIVVDPDRSNRSAFSKEMVRLGFDFTSHPAKRFLESGEAYKGRFLNFDRTGPFLP